MDATSQQVNETFVGYDAREYRLPLDQSWDERRKQEYLYRLDVLKPLSVDTRVWPTIFASEGRSAPVGFLGFKDSWSNFLELQKSVTQAYQEKPMPAWRMVAITLFLGEYCENDRVPWASRLPPCNPNKKGKDWTFLGYDVGDQYMLSALSNCGFLADLDDIPQLRAEWGPRLNKFHLFQTMENAVLFKRFSDERLRDDHAPCFIFGLWIIK